jgi:hypothetical protein
VAGSDTGAVVAMEIFIEENRIPPEWIILEFPGASIDRTSATVVTKENVRQSPRNLRGNLIQGDQLTGSDRALDFVLVTQKIMKFLE